MDKDLHNIVAPLIEQHEGRRPKPYACTAGKTTIGIGRNLDDRGLSNDEINFLFAGDLAQAENDAITAIGLSDYSRLSRPRRAALIDMAFNLGLTRLLQFKNTLLAIKQERYTDAAEGMLASKWASQVGQRAETLARMMQEG